jgi:hypothetical protein
MVVAAGAAVVEVEFADVVVAALLLSASVAAQAVPPINMRANRPAG